MTDLGQPGGTPVRPGWRIPAPANTMEILGHSRIAVTLEIYTAADDASRRDAIEQLNQLFGNGSR